MGDKTSGEEESPRARDHVWTCVCPACHVTKTDYAAMTPCEQRALSLAESRQIPQQKLPEVAVIL